MTQIRLTGTGYTKQPTKYILRGLDSDYRYISNDLWGQTIPFASVPSSYASLKGVPSFEYVLDSEESYLLSVWQSLVQEAPVTYNPHALIIDGPGDEDEDTGGRVAVSSQNLRRVLHAHAAAEQQQQQQQ